MNIKRISALVLSAVSALVFVSQWVAIVSARPKESQSENGILTAQSQIQVRINEILPNPVDGEAEFVELVMGTEGSILYLPLVFGGSEGHMTRLNPVWHPRGTLQQFP